MFNGLRFLTRTHMFQFCDIGTHMEEGSVVVVWLVISSWGDGSLMFTSCDEMLPIKTNKKNHIKKESTNYY